ncbi:MAG: hypothetical protein R3A13_10145 [Bdellovibrionota bacterium]
MTAETDSLSTEISLADKLKSKLLGKWKIEREATKIESFFGTATFTEHPEGLFYSENVKFLPLKAY